ncbi:MAG: hypothetical protein GXZ05_08150 [Gammaproteobacteria bacterium]|nr:hypothetical protein [Gammaproteobacteria bacterium]
MLKVFVKRLVIYFSFCFSFLFVSSNVFASGIIESSSYSWNNDSSCGGSTPSFLVVHCTSSRTYYCRPIEGYKVVSFVKHSEIPLSVTCYHEPIKPDCPAGSTYNEETGECVPEPDQCEAGKETSIFKFIPNDTVVSYPATACLAGCTFAHTSSMPCWYPLEKDGVLGSECKITYTGTGEECSGGDDPDSPPDVPPDSENPPDGPPNPDCKRFTNADGSWGYDCNPKPDPDENNECPPGYQMQGNTCFRIPPDHPDYDPDKDPQKPGGDDDPDDDTGSGSGDGDLKGVAQETTLKSIDKTLKDIDGSIKSGNSTTHSLLQGIKDAIGKIPGGGGGSGNGNGSGAGDGDGEGGPTKPESGSFDEAIAEQDEAIEGFKEELKTKFNQFKEYQIEGLTLSGGGGSLPSVTVSFGIFGTHTLDFGQYAEPLSNLGGIFVFMCGLLAVLIIFVRG